MSAVLALKFIDSRVPSTPRPVEKIGVALGMILADILAGR